jgi:hypothetical protein
LGSFSKTLDRILRGTSDANTRFADLRTLLLSLGFAERVRGSHHIFTRDGVAEILNLQPRGKLAKPYQVRQVRGVIVAYKLAETLGDEGKGEQDEQETPEQPQATERQRKSGRGSI